jgi:SAM-dependent methyltransferase
MPQSIEQALEQACALIVDTKTLVRVVLSGRRRNMQVEHERIDIRPVEIKGSIVLQLTYNDGKATTTKNIAADKSQVLELLSSGYANITVDNVEGSTSIRVTKSGEAQVHFENKSLEQNLSHDKKKERLLDPADPFLLEVGIADHKGQIKPSKNDKYKQVEEFLRLLVPTLNSAIEAGQIAKPSRDKPLSIVDLGCGHAYLTFAAHQYLRSIGMSVHITGIDVRPASRDRNNEIAAKLGITDTITFKAEEIASTTANRADDAIAWAVNGGAKLLLIAPCCHHDIQKQMDQSPEPWGAITKFGVMKERMGDLLTDALRAQILRIVGYRVEIIEFIGGEHTPRNIMIRAVKTGAQPDALDIDRYRDITTQWGVVPALSKKISTFTIG